MILPVLFAVISFLLGWRSETLRKALLQGLLVGLAATAFLAVAWTIWDDSASDILNWASSGGAFTVVMVVLAGIGSWLRARRDVAA